MVDDMVTRREFLHGVGRAGGFGAAFLTLQGLGQIAQSASDGRAPALHPKSGNGVSVAILGAGISGLAAAYELNKAGYSCHLIEANNRVGGRNFTLRQGSVVDEVGRPEQTCSFDEGLYFNAGAARIPSTHRALLGYCKEFAIELEVFINDNRNALFQDDRALAGTPVQSRQLHNDSAGHISELLAKAIDHGALDAELTPDDGEMLLSFLSQYGDLDSQLRYRGSSRSGYEVHPGAGQQFGKPRAPIPLSDILHSGFWQWKLRYEEEILQQTTMFQPVGGMDRIAEAFAARLSPHLTLNAEVTAIRRTNDGVNIEYVDKNSDEERLLRSDYCICTIPLNALLGVDADFSAQHYEAMEGVFYNSAVKLAWQAKRRFWEEDLAIYGGISFVEHEIEQVWYPCSGYHGQKGVLQGAYSVYEAADYLGSALPQKRAEIALEGAAKLHPAMGKHVSSPISVAWQNMPYNIGCWAEWDETQRGSAYQTLLKPDGPIYFAGEHMSHLPGWQEGAILSAHHVVADLDASLSRSKANGDAPAMVE